MAKPAEIKTKKNDASVEEFISKIPDERQREDTRVVAAMMEKAMKVKPKMWGSSMIGFGEKRYKSAASGREVDWFIIGFSPRKANLSLHLIDMQRHEAALLKLGKFKLGSGCLYINKLAEVDVKVLQKMITAAAK